MSLPPEILKKVKLLEINTRRLVNNLFVGEYHSAFKGQGMIFSEFREYVPGDDVRAISWPVTARAGKPYIKKFDEERESTLILAVDISGSAQFGSGKYFKGEVMTYLAALLSFSASKNHDAVGLLLFTDQVEHYVPPKKGVGHVHRILRDLYYFQPKSSKTQISPTLEFLLGVLKKRAHIFLLSDFMGDIYYEKPLRMIKRKHDVVAVVINDHLEIELPPVGLIDIQDAETGEIMTVDTSSPGFQRDYRKVVQRGFEERDRLLQRSQVDRINIVSDEDFIQPLVSFFKSRNHR